MSDYPYILNTGRLKSFLELIPRIGVPDKITVQTLPRLGYTSENDRPIVKILKFIGFIDSDGVPTQDYMNFRDTSIAGVVMAKVLRRAYCELFNVYPDAYKRDDETLKNFFRPTTRASEQVVERMVDTFKALCSYADFETSKEAETLEAAAKIMELRAAPKSITLNININLNLPLTDDGSVYDKIFKSIRENLFSMVKEQST
ncbi:MAG: DUF5343 domain-containing protein [Candidatus Bathyarchaeia archaeon]